MKTKIIYSLILFVISLNGFSTTWTVTNSGFTFTPATITITFGDTVDFNISSQHNATEVSQATWNINGNTPLSGGFQTPFGGGTVYPSQLSVGTHYYVCEPHASMGMKGIIIVQNCTIPAQPGIISGNATVCSGSTNTYSIASVTGATSYTWTLPGGWTGTSVTNSITSMAGITAGNISVTANNACGSSPVRTIAVAVNTPPAQPGVITGNTQVCSGTSNTYSITPVTGATSYTWNLPGGWTGTSTTTSILATASATSGNITVSANNTCGASALRIFNVTVNTPPAQPSIIIGNASVCQDSSITFSVTPVAGATSYTWTLPVGWTGTSTTNTINAVAGSTSGNITVMANNICGSSIVRILNITVNTPVTQPGIISGNTTVCSGSTNTYSVAAVTGATSYTWTLPVGWTGTSVTNSLTAVAGITAGNLSVTANNACGSSPVRTLNVAVNTAPAQPGAITGNSPVCSGTSNTYSITAVTGATSYTWNLPIGWTGTSTTTSILATASATSGNITVTANNTCGASTLRILNVTVNTTPAQPSAIIGNANVCEDSVNTYSVAAITGATSYTWILPVGWTGTSTTNTIITVAGSTSGNISVTANNTCGSSIQRLLGVSINAPLAQPGTISGSDTVCKGESNIFSVLPVAGAISYTWTLPVGWTGTSTTNTINAVAVSSGGTISVMANNACGSSAAQTKNVLLKQVDTSVLVSGNSITANAAGGSYVWLDCNTNLPVSGQINQSFTPAVTGNYAVVVTVNGCSDTSSCYNITIVGIHENATSSAVTLFPNPSDGKFNIVLKRKGNERVEIFNLIGERILQSDIHNQNTAIDLSNHPAGIYFVKIYAENSVVTKKMLVQ